MLLGPRGEEGRLFLQPRGAAPALCTRAADPQEERAGRVRGAASFGGGCCSFYALRAVAFLGGQTINSGAITTAGSFQDLKWSGKTTAKAKSQKRFVSMSPAFLNRERRREQY